MPDTNAPIDQVVDLLRRLHLSHMRRQAPEVLPLPGRTLGPAEAVRALLTEELGGQRASSMPAGRPFRPRPA